MFVQTPSSHPDQTFPISSKKHSTKPISTEDTHLEALTSSPSPKGKRYPSQTILYGISVHHGPAFNKHKQHGHFQFYPFYHKTKLQLIHILTSKKKGERHKPPTWWSPRWSTTTPGAPAASSWWTRSASCSSCVSHYAEMCFQIYKMAVRQILQVCTTTQTCWICPFIFRI